MSASRAVTAAGEMANNPVIAINAMHPRNKMVE